MQCWYSTGAATAESGPEVKTSLASKLTTATLQRISYSPTLAGKLPKLKPGFPFANGPKPFAFDGSAAKFAAKDKNPIARYGDWAPTAVPEKQLSGRVICRFPPEPSGYLHIGHVKAMMMSVAYAERYDGEFVVRFDDTNPEKEKEEFEKNIIIDLGRLGIVPDRVSRTSQHFPLITRLCRELLRDGNAYMDCTPQDVLQQERFDMKDGKYRATTPEVNLRRFDMMCAKHNKTKGVASTSGGKKKKSDKDAKGKGNGDGTSAPAEKNAEEKELEWEGTQSWFMRLKISMQHKNSAMRDPAVFRLNDKAHPLTKTKYNPMYDIACPIVDSIEGITHAIRTDEYMLRNPVG